MGTRLLLIFSSAAFLCSGECIRVGPPQFGRVEVSAFSSLGERLPTLDVDLIEVGTRKSFKSRLKGAVGRQVPYGTYLVRVSAAGFRTSERKIYLDQPEAIIRIQLSVSVECGSDVEIRGSIRSAPADRELWVKVVPLKGAGGAEARVRQDGSFLTERLDPGQYLLLVVDGEAIVHTASLQVPRRSPVDVDLGELLTK